MFEYFYEKMRLFSPLMDRGKTEDKTEVSIKCDLVIEECTCISCGTVSFPWLQIPVAQTTTYLTRSLILALSVCYHSRLQKRKEFEEGVVRQFIAPLFLPGGVKQFQTEIKK